MTSRKMLFFKNICLFFLLLVFSIPAFGSNDASASRAGWPRDNSDLSPDPAVIHGRLENGFRYMLLKNDNPKDRVSLHLNIQAGSLDESDEQRGLAHFLEHMMFCGTTHFPPGEIVKFFQSIGMQFGPDANAHTGYDETVYDLLLPRGDRDSLQEGMTVLRDFAAGALLEPDEIDRERGVILAEKRARDSASFRIFKARQAFQFKGSRIPQRLPIGIESVLKSADRDLLKSYYDAWYRPDKMVLVMAGDFDPKTAESLIGETFGGLDSRAPAPSEPETGDFDHRGVKSFFYYEKEAGDADVEIEVIRKIAPESDTAENRKLRVVQSLANRILNDRLDEALNRPETPYTSAGAGSGVFLDSIEYAAISAQSGPDKWEASLAAIEQSLRRALEFGFQPEELERVKKEFLTALNTAVEKADTRESRALAGEMIRTLNDRKVFLSPRQERDLLFGFVESLTVEQVNGAFKQLWDAGHRLVMVTGNAETADRDAGQERVRDVYLASSKQPVEKAARQATVAFPYLPAPEKSGKIASRQDMPDGIVVVNFENGVRLNIKKTDYKAREVLVDIAFGGGRSHEPRENPGLALLGEAVVNESGLGKLERSALERAMAGSNTAASFDIDDASFHLRGRTVTQEIPLLFQLLYSHLEDPAFRPTAYRLAMKRFDQEYAALSQSIEGRMRLSVMRFFAGGDERFGMPPYEVLQKSGLKDIQNWVGDALKNAPLEISVVGDLDVEQVIDVVGTYMGSLPSRVGQHAGSVNNSRTPEFPENGRLVEAVETRIPKAVVVVAYPTDDIWDIHRTRRLSVLADIFSERLRERIREKLGATYSPYAFNNPSRAYDGYGFMQAVINVDPAQADAVIEEVRKIAADLKKNGVKPGEFKRAVEPLLTGIKDMRQNNEYWLKTVLSGSKKHPEQIEWSRTIVSDYASITIDEVSRLAARYLDNETAAVAVIEPGVPLKTAENS